MNINVIQGDHIEWEQLDIIFEFEKTISDTQSNEVKEIINAWYVLGGNRAFGGLIHNMSEIWSEDNKIGFWADTGSAEPECLDILFDAIEGFGEINNVKINRIIMGGIEEDDEDEEETT